MIWTIVFGILNTLFTAFIGFIIWKIKTNNQAASKKQLEKDSCYEEFNIQIMNTTIAAVTLSEVTAQAVKDGHVNGNLKISLDAAKKVKDDYLTFITKQGIKNIINLRGE